MKIKNISLRTAVIVPIVIIMLMILGIFVYFNQRDYDFLAKEQGSKILEALYLNTEQRISELLMEPQRANGYYEDYIARAELFDLEDKVEVEAYTLEFMKKVRQDLPQISAMSFGDEQGDFAGFRVNDDDSYGLMVKDSRTNYDLNIYANETMDSELLAGFEGYDPRTRPWYVPVKDNQLTQWSEVYVNYDEKMELTVTSLVPVFDKKGTFRGVAGTDVKFDMINEFLIGEPIKGNGVIYIVDQEWNILAHSLEEDYVKVIEGDPPTAVMLHADESSNEMIRASAQVFESLTGTSGDIEQVMIGDERHFALYSPLKEPESLGWNIVVVIPETDVMGAVKERQTTTLWVVSLLLLFGMLTAMYLLSRITKPILQSSEAALGLSKGNFETKLEVKGLQLFETRELVDAFNNMSENLKGSFEQIKRSESKYRSLVQNVDDMIYSISKDGHFLSMNNTFERIVSRRAEELVGKHYLDIFTREESKTFWSLRFDRAVVTKEKQSFRFDYSDDKVGERTLSVKLIPQVNSEGDVVSVLCTNTDITELVNAQEELERLLKAENQELESLVKIRTSELETTMQELIDRERLASLGSLVAGIAHEINTPLGVAVTAGSYMETVNNQIGKKLKEGKLSKNDLVDYINSINESSEIINSNLLRASELIRSFKEISVNQSIETITEFSVYDYLHDVMLALKHEYKNTEHTFNIECPRTLEIKNYPGAFSQILTNLIMNSLIHGFDGINNGNITIRAQKVSDDFVLEYEDDGVGISKDNMSKIFDPFFTTNRKKGGSGLGLNIVYNIITGKLNGKVSCESTLGEGVKFVIRIPLNSESN